MSRRPAYIRDRFGNVWEYYDHESLPDQRRKRLLSPQVLDAMIADGFVFKFKRDDFREQHVNCECHSSTVDDVEAKNTNQPPEEF